LSLEQAADFLIRHGYVVLFGWVLLEQMGLPIPAAPLLIAAGALARAGKMNLTFAVALAFVAVILADLFWYSLGRYRGGRILKLLCRISLEPDSFVRRTENVFFYRGVSSDDPGCASYRYGRDRRAPRRDSPGSRRRPLLLVTQ